MITLGNRRVLLTPDVEGLKLSTSPWIGQNAADNFAPHPPNPLPYAVMFKGSQTNIPTRLLNTSSVIIYPVRNYEDTFIDG